jgi:hypothetical protein
MIGREDGNVVRLCGYDPTLEYCSDVFHALGYNGDTFSVLLAEAFSLSSHVCVDVDADQDGIKSTVGIEIYPGSLDATAGDGWGRTLEWLEDRNLCRAGERAAMSQFPRSVAVPELTSPVLGGHRTSEMVAVAHHIKLTFRPGQRVRAKAYVAIWRDWRSSIAQAGGAEAK